MAKNYTLKCQKLFKFWLKILIFEVIYWSLERKIHLNVVLLGIQTMPKHFLNNAGTTLKKPECYFFYHHNEQKWPSQMLKLRLQWITTRKNQKTSSIEKLWFFHFRYQKKCTILFFLKLGEHIRKSQFSTKNTSHPRANSHLNKKLYWGVVKFEK